MTSEQPTTGINESSPTTGEPAPADRAALVKKLTWITPVATVVSALITLGVFLSTQFSGGPDTSGLIAQYGLAVAVFAVPSLWLLVAIVRHRQQLSAAPRLRSTGIAIGVVCLILGSLISGRPLVEAIASEVRTAILTSADPTPAETAYSPRELGVAAESIIVDTLSPLTAGAAISAGDEVISGPCRTSNLARGTYFTGAVRAETTVRPDEAQTAVTTQLEQRGFTILSDPGEVNSANNLYAAATGDIMDALSVAVDDAGIAFLVFTTVCVVGELD